MTSKCSWLDTKKLTLLTTRQTESVWTFGDSESVAPPKNAEETEPIDESATDPELTEPSKAVIEGEDINSVTTLRFAFKWFEDRGRAIHEKGDISEPPYCTIITKEAQDRNKKEFDD